MRGEKMAVSYMSALRDFNMGDNSLDQGKTESVDDSSSSNEADFDDELEIITENAPLVDLTEHQPGEGDAANGNEVELVGLDDPEVELIELHDPEVDLTELDDQEIDPAESNNQQQAGELETVSNGDVNKIDTNIQRSEEAETLTSSDVPICNSSTGQSNNAVSNGPTDAQLDVIGPQNGDNVDAAPNSNELRPEKPELEKCTNDDAVSINSTDSNKERSESSVEKRIECSGCHNIFHGWCSSNSKDAVSSTGEWLCSKCKCLDDQCSRSSSPGIENVVCDESTISVDLSIVKKEKIDCNANSAVEHDSTMDEDYLDVKHKIVDSVARNFFMRKMHHASRTRECVTVPRNHFGPIPGVEVGTCWRFRLSVSESGVHRPLVAGIHGRSSEGAYSIVLSGVYDDDQDFGDHFLYCGSGGRAKDPTKRYSAQIAHQTLENGNRALALCCNAPLNSKEGAEAEDWQGGKPVRVVRNYRLSKHSKFAPEVGNRYDGIYKVVKYFPTIGRVGFVVWKFLMRRDDPVPAPWTEEGKKLIEEKNLTDVIWPDDYGNENIQPLVQTSKDSTRSLRKRQSEPHPKATRRSLRKRKLSEIDPEDFDSEEDPDDIDLDELVRKSRKRRLNDPDFPSGNEKKRATDEAVFSRSGRRLRSDDPKRQIVKFGYIKCEGGGKETVAVPVPTSGCENEDGANEQEQPDVKPDVNKLRASLSRRGRPRKQSLNSSVDSVNHAYNTRARRNDANGDSSISETSDMPINIRIKVEPFDLPDDVRALMKKDTLNKKFWKNIHWQLKKGEEEFRKYMKEKFTCRFCSKMMNCPVTTTCEHNVCKECLTDNFSKKVFTCPVCETDLGSSFEITENENVAIILQKLFPNQDSESTETN